MHTNSMHELPTDLATYISQMKYYERMHKVKEREQHIQEVSLTFFDNVYLIALQKVTVAVSCLQALL